MAKKAAPAGGQVIGYARVSTDKQDADRQRLDIQAYAEAQGLALARVVMETVSSRKKDREIFGLVESLAPGDVLVVTEISRLSRSSIELDGICSKIVERGATLESLTPRFTVDGSLIGQTMKFAIGIAAQIERSFISERTKSALRARKAGGMKLGRPAGQGVKVPEAAKAAGVSLAEIDRMLGAGASAATVARLLSLDARTVLRWSQERKAARV